MRFEVIVGNVGCVHRGDDWNEARKVWVEYARQSREGEGRASGEPVYFMEGDKILREVAGELV